MFLQLILDKQKLVAHNASLVGKERVTGAKAVDIELTATMANADIRTILKVLEYYTYFIFTIYVDYYGVCKVSSAVRDGFVLFA